MIITHMMELFTYDYYTYDRIHNGKAIGNINDAIKSSHWSTDEAIIPKSMTKHLI